MIDMENICPLCNNIRNYFSYCPECGSKTVNVGYIEEFLDPYSPYLSLDITQREFQHDLDSCFHALECPNCKGTFVYPIKKIVM
jgi:Zn finger protein HypA/HybF involved in hydrogenase expression